MKREDLLALKTQLTDKLETVELEKAQLVRKLRAIDILLEDSNLHAVMGLTSELGSSSRIPDESKLGRTRKRTIPAHAVRTSPRSSLIDAVLEIAAKQPGPFDSGQLLKALQIEYPEFKLTETKHISSPLSDLVKKGMLILDQKRTGSKSNIYRVQNPK